MTLTCPAIGLITCYYCLTEDWFDWKSGILCMALFISALAFSYRPTISSDLVRYAEYVEALSYVPFSKALGVHQYGKDGLWLFAYICWFISKTGEPYLLPAFSCFCTYYIGMYVSGKVGEDLNADKRSIKNHIFFIVMTASFYSLVNNVRNVFAFTIVGYAIFRDVYEKKRDPITLACYILPIYIHPSAITIVVCRLLIPFISKFKIPGLAICFFTVDFVDLAYDLTANMSDSGTLGVIKNTIHKAHSYFHDTSSGWGLVVQRSGSERLAKMLQVSLAIIIVMLVLYCTREIGIRKSENRCSELESRLEPLLNAVYIMGLLTIAMVPMLTPEYWRFAHVTILFSGPVYLYTDKLLKEEKRDDVLSSFIHLLTVGMQVIMFGMLAYWVRNTLLSERLRLFLNPFISSPIAILFKAVFRRMLEFIGAI